MSALTFLPPLTLQLLGQTQERLAGHVGKGCPEPSPGSQLRDQHRRRLDDAIDENTCIHAERSLGFLCSTSEPEPAAGDRTGAPQERVLAMSTGAAPRVLQSAVLCAD